MKTLHGRLVLVLLALMLPLSGFYIYIILRTSQQYYQEITQKQNMDLARRILDEASDLMLDGQVDEAKLDKTAAMLAMTNPGVEVYLVDPAGQIRGSSIPMQNIRRSQVNLADLQAFLSGDASFPLHGVDPRSTSGNKIFSVAEMDGYAGYLYVLLADESRDSIMRTVQNSTVLKVSLWVMLVAIGAVVAFGIWIFSYLTSRLRRLSKTVSAFRAHDFVLEAPQQRLVVSDELDQLHNAFIDMAERISEQMQGLRQVDTLRRELITNVSHDLRTPLAALQGYLETLQLKAQSLSEAERHHYLLAATKHSQRLGKLIKDLFDLSRLDAQAVEIQTEAFLLQELAQDIVAQFEGVARDKDIRLYINADKALPFVRADIGLIERALSNLLENALKYTPPGGKVRLELHKQPSGIEVSICDTGQGIPEEDLPFVFERFYRAKGSHDQTGSGLGLAITKRILALHQQEITVYSQPNQGSSFRFCLPLA